MSAPQLRSLFECLSEVPEYRKSRGKRYQLSTVLSIAVAARLAGYRGVNAFAEYAALLSQEQLKMLEAFFSPTQKHYTAPAITTFHNILADLLPDTLDEAIGRWKAKQADDNTPNVING